MTQRLGDLLQDTLIRLVSKFTREYSRGCIYDPLSLVIDPVGVTLASYRAAWGLAFGWYVGFLKQVRERLATYEVGAEDVGDYTWGSTDADAVEWLYRLRAGKVILHKGEPETA